MPCPGGGELIGVELGSPAAEVWRSRFDCVRGDRIEAQVVVEIDCRTKGKTEFRFLVDDECPPAALTSLLSRAAEMFEAWSNGDEPNEGGQ